MSPPPRKAAARPRRQRQAGLGEGRSQADTHRAGWRGPNAADTAYTVTISSTDDGEERARPVSAEPLPPLLLEPAALAVREGGRIVRETQAADGA